MRNGQREARGLKPPPTRLQKKAPASLKLDYVATTASCTNNPFSSNETPKAIPLLSPLILSPQSLPEMSEKQRFRCSNNQQDDDGKNEADSSRGQHTAVPMFTNPSTLYTFFRSQCMIVNTAHRETQHD